MIRRPPRSTRTDTLFPYTTLFRSLRRQRLADQRALLRGQLVAQHAARDGVPAAFHGKLVDLPHQPRQAQRVAEAEVHPGHVHRLELALPRDLDDVAAQFPVGPRRQRLAQVRSEESQVWEDCVSTWSSRGSPYHITNK